MVYLIKVKPVESIKKQLENLKNSQFKQFSENIINTSYPIIGVKTDILKKIAKDNINNYKQYFSEKHEYYEEYMIHGFMLGYINIPFIDLTKYIDDYINMIDSWAMVDSIVSNLKIFKKYLKEVYTLAKQYILSKKEFKVRFGYCIFLTYFINSKQDEYIDEILYFCNKLFETYYVQMMVAWLLSVSYIKYKEKTIVLLKQNNIDNFTFNKTISKICDSFRVEKAEKEILKKMLRK